MLTTRQLDILHALIDTLIPPDEYAGGWAAGVGDYLLRQFGGDLAQALPLYRLGLESLDAEAQAAHGKGFDALTAAERDSLLKQVEAGTVTARWEIDPRGFVAMAAEHAAEGFYSDPGNGGNRDGIAWKMIGFEVRG